VADVARASGLRLILATLVCVPCVAETIYKSPNPRRSTCRSISSNLTGWPTNETTSRASSIDRSPSSVSGALWVRFMARPIDDGSQMGLRKNEQLFLILSRRFGRRTVFVLLA